MEEISLQSGSLERVFPYSLCTFECMFCLLPVYSTIEEIKNVGTIHRLRSAETFVHDWQVSFCFSVKMKAFPSFYQFVVHTVFKELIKMHYPVSCCEGNETELPSRPLTCEEQNALRYVAGYVIRKLRERIDSSSNPRKDEMVLLLMECAGDEMDSDGGTEMWVNMIDRGGLMTKPTVCL